MKGILFKDWKIKAIAEDDREWMTRRVIKPQPRRIDDAFDGTWEWKEKEHYYDDLTLFHELKHHSRYQVGEVVYIKEAWYAEKQYDHLKPRDIPLLSLVGYPLRDIKPDWAGRLRSPMFLRWEFARLFRKITDIRAERLQEITVKDIKAEGVTTKLLKKAFTKTELDDIYRGNFSYLWNSINPKYPWESNPFVWVYSFKKAEK